MQCCSVLSECRWVEDDEVVLLVVLIEILEGILAECLMTLVTREIERDVLIGQFDGLGTAIHGVYLLGIASHRIDGETAGIAEHVEHALALGILLQKGAVVTLVNEEAGLLASQPVDMEFQSIFHRHIVGIATDDETILLTQVSLEWQGGLALVVDVLDAVAHHVLEGLCDFLAIHVHAHTMSLHHGSLAIAVNDQAWQVVALAMHQAISIVGRIVGYAHGDAHTERRLQARAPELAINLDVAE